jgi:hypothetical protein
MAALLIGQPTQPSAKASAGTDGAVDSASTNVNVERPVTLDWWVVGKDEAPRVAEGAPRVWSFGVVVHASAGHDRSGPGDALGIAWNPARACGSPPTLFIPLSRYAWRAGSTCNTYIPMVAQRAGVAVVLVAGLLPPLRSSSSAALPFSTSVSYGHCV